MFNSIQVSDRCSLLKSDRLLEIIPFGWAEQDLMDNEQIFAMEFDIFGKFFEGQDLYIKENGTHSRIITKGKSWVFHKTNIHIEAKFSFNQWERAIQSSPSQR